jgi:hypothetical protein
MHDNHFARIRSIWKPAAAAGASTSWLEYMAMACHAPVSGAMCGEHAGAMDRCSNFACGSGAPGGRASRQIFTVVM